MLTRTLDFVKGYNKCKIYIITGFKRYDIQPALFKLLRNLLSFELNFTKLNKTEEKRQFFESYILYIYVSDK